MKTLGIGLYWDDLEVGERFKTLNRTVTEADIVNFIGVTGMVETLFTDLTFGDHGGGPMGGRVAPAALVYTMTATSSSEISTWGGALLSPIRLRSSKCMSMPCRRDKQCPTIDASFKVGMIIDNWHIDMDDTNELGGTYLPFLRRQRTATTAPLSGGATVTVISN